jgi:hypothetical protein
MTTTNSISYPTGIIQALSFTELEEDFAFQQFEDFTNFNSSTGYDPRWDLESQSDFETIH